MKFTGQIRIPEVDHPGIPAAILVEDAQIEILLDGESLGRWSLYDVRARRLVSAAFQLELDVEELTFIADEPIDFAYRGVDHMAETWARIKAMRAIPRSLAVKRSRKGVKPSRIGELRAAMEANLEAERRPAPKRPTSYEPHVPSPSTEAPTNVPETADLLAEERAHLEQERRGLAEERARLEELRREAEERDARRIEAFRLEMARLESERAEHERIEADRSRRFQEEMERLREERDRLQTLDAELTTRAGEDAAREQTVRQELESLEAARREMEKAEAERIAAAEREMAEVEARRQELERMEAESLERRRAEHEVAAALQAEQEALAAARAADEAATAPADDEPPADEEVAGPPEPVFADEPEPDGVPEQEMETPEREVVVDLDELEEAPEPALATAGSPRSGLMGAVRSAFTRGSRNHSHDFVLAPGGLGITRSICRDCGYVSISTDD